MFAVVSIVLAIFLVAAVIGMILHPIETLRKLLRFVLGLFAVCLVIGSIPVFLMPKSTFGDWIGPVLVLIGGFVMAWLYNLLAPRTY